jgi:hypothetical protein
LTTPTITIMPSSRKMTSQSIPKRSEWNASAEDTSPRASISPAPVCATATRLAFSVAISA